MINSGDFMLYSSHRPSWLLCFWSQPHKVIMVMNENMSHKGWFTLELMMMATRDFK